MKISDLLRLIDQMQHDKNIKRDVIFDGIEAAVQLAAQKHFGEEAAIEVVIDRDTGEIQVTKGGEPVDPSELGRIPAQSAKNVMIQKIREAESNAVFTEFTTRKGDLVHGVVQRHESGAAVVSIGRTEAILPRGEQIPGETYHVGDRVKAVIVDVKKSGQRVKIILSRTHPDFVRRLFENEIPEIADHIIEIKAVAREAGYRTKIAVSSIDLKVDCVGACVGVRGSRIKNIVDELGGERIDIVRWNDSLQVMIPNALQPAQIKDVFLYPRPGRAIILVEEDQLSLAIGRRGQNVRLASKLVGWDIEIMTHDELTDSIEKALVWFMALPGMSEEVVEACIEEGFMSYDDLSLCDAAELAEIMSERGLPIDEDVAEQIIASAEDAAEKMEQGIDISATDEDEEEAGEVAEGEAADEAAYEGEPGGEAGEAPYDQEAGEAAYDEEAGEAPPSAEDWDETADAEADAAEPEAGAGEAYAADHFEADQESEEPAAEADAAGESEDEPDQGFARAADEGDEAEGADEPPAGDDADPAAEEQETPPENVEQQHTP